MRQLLENQSVNAFLWVPFLMAFGAALYFNLSAEPNVNLCIVGAIVAGAVALCRVHFAIRAIAIFIFGFCYACGFTHFINTPQITREIHNAEIVGTVRNIDYTSDKTRVYIKLPANQIGAGDRDTIVRVSLKSNITPPKIGDKIRATIGLFRPDGADAPESFDYARWAYFNGLTANGYMTEFDIITPAHKTSIATLRDYIHRRANSFLADTLVLGYKNAVPDDDTPVWTATGVGHVWSISGFHITLVSAWLVTIFYFIFRAMPCITKRIPARKPAIVCAWFGLLFYVVLSGGDVATIRAFIMASLIFLAFLFGRNAISMRNVCLAFSAIFLTNPHFVMQPGFQLSFAAIFGLVWLWGDANPKMPRNKILKITYTAILTSITATLFTAPFVVMHFYELPIYGLIGNLVLLPVFSVAIMPLACVGVVGATFGWMWPLDFANQIYDLCLTIGNYIATLPGATLLLPHIPNIAMVFIILGFMSLIFIRNIRVKINYICAAIFFTIGIRWKIRIYKITRIKSLFYF